MPPQFSGPTALSALGKHAKTTQSSMWLSRGTPEPAVRASIDDPSIHPSMAWINQLDLGSTIQLESSIHMVLLVLPSLNPLTELRLASSQLAQAC